MTDQDRRAALAAAFDKAEETDAEAQVLPTEQEGQQAELPLEQKPDAYKVEAEAAAADAKPTEAAAADAKPTEAAAAADAKPTDEPAPISWKAEEKAHWAKVPPEVRAIISRRELETQRALSTSAQARKFNDEFARTVSPYAHLIRAQNSTPIQAVDNLMRTAAGLTVGSPQQKAAIIAEIIGNYGVDLQTLDAVLSNQPAPQNVGHASVPPQFAQMLQPVYQFMEKVNSSRQTYEQQQAAKIEEEVSTFGADKPFFDEVREEMADLMEVAAKRGKTLTLEQAYNVAISADPKYASAIQQRTHANDVSAAAATLARARRAASSVAGAPNGSKLTPKAPTTRREALEQAYEDKTGG